MKKYLNVGTIILTIGLFFLLFGVTNVRASGTIDDVTVTGLKNPEIGETVKDNIANVKVPEGVNYAIDSVEWWVSEDGMIFSPLSDDDSFEAGLYYYCYVLLVANDGYDFPMDENDEYTGNVSTSDVSYQFTQQDDPGTLSLIFDSILLSNNVTPTETKSEVAPPNTRISKTNTNDNLLFYISILGLSTIGLYYKKKKTN